MNNNIGVAVLDTGIYKHIDFGNRIIAFKDFINNRVFPYDDSGHGTSPKSRGEEIDLATQTTSRHARFRHNRRRWLCKSRPIQRNSPYEPDYIC